MIKEQAKLFFPHSPGDDLEELWEERFFKQKQFFLTHPPIRKVWEARLQRLNQQFEAYLMLIDQEKKSLENLSDVEAYVFSDDFIISFHEFHALRNKHKTLVLKAQTMNELKDAIQQWLALEHQFAVHWKHPTSENDEIEVVRSKEPDPMDLLKDLKQTSKAIESSSLKALKENYNYLSESVKKEVKRLTLLAKD